MNIMLQVAEKYVPFMLELLSNFKFVKAKPMCKTKAVFLSELSEAVEEVKLARSGKKKLKTLDQVINELSD